ncbi:MAG: lysine exporter LysO family protein [Thermoplasmata archaeon]|nr:lysine exporter LysO family protein [Thermoplasmata archaeon]
MALDLYLYLAFGAGFVAGRVHHVDSIWVGFATLGTVLALLLLLGALLGSTPHSIPLILFPLAFLFALSTVLLSAGIALFWQPKDRGAPTQPARAPPLTVILFPAVLLLGIGVGRMSTLPFSPLVSWSLYVLLFLVAYDLRIVGSALRKVPIPIVAATSSAVIVGLAFGFIPGLSIPLSLGSAVGFGWYTLAGPLAAAQLGAAAGIFAFTSNFLRELLTMLLAPALGARVRAEGLAAMGGATAMDTTLWFVKEYGDRDAGSLALASGLVLTVAASLLVPLALALP